MSVRIFHQQLCTCFWTSQGRANSFPSIIHSIALHCLALPCLPLTVNFVPLCCDGDKPSTYRTSSHSPGSVAHQIPGTTMAPTSSNDAATLSSSSSTQMKHPQNGPTPLPIRVLATVQSPGDDDQNATHDGSAEAGKNYYQVLHRLYSVSPLAPRDGQLLWNGIDRIDEDDGCRGEIETSLEQYVVPETASSSSSSSRTPNYTGTTHQKQHRVLWRRVVVRSGPSTDGRKVTHASYQLPEECNNATYNSSLLGSSSSSSSSLSPSVLCWTSFPDRPRHLMLCVLASPTLLCIWDVYPTQNVASDKKNDDGEGRQANKQQESLSGGESHMIPLPFEAEAIFAVEDSRGLLIQRAETPEDFVTWTTSSTHQPSLGSPASTTTPTANSIMMSQGDDDDNKKKQKGTDTDGGFVLKDPPKKAPPSSRPRESLGGHSFASSLNVSTTGTSVGAATSQTGDMQSIPSMFSLSHPYDDILPVSTFTDEGWHHSLASDVFEKIVFVGQATWMDDNSSGIPFMDRKVQTQNICVKYHTQYKTYVPKNLLLFNRDVKNEREFEQGNTSTHLIHLFLFMPFTF